MMFKKSLLICLILINLNIGLAFCDNTKDNILILYQSNQSTDFSLNKTYKLYKLLSNFKNDIQSKDISDYSQGEISNYEYIFIFFETETLSINKYILDDIYLSKKDIFWIGPNINHLINEHKLENIDYNGFKKNFLSVYYKENNYKIPSSSNFTIITSDKSDIICNLYDGKYSYPYILKLNNLHFVSSFNLSTQLYFVLSDYLNDFFNANINTYILPFSITNSNDYIIKTYVTADIISSGNYSFIDKIFSSLYSLILIIVISFTFMLLGFNVLSVSNLFKKR
ncbi:hypothetical protein [Tepidibacter aestuarii]|uniref:hypothetical protein n=1 Tax=Tepidibacter aestuarii TaxID=2925782 RepID=UPI0020C14728|nr:hypothetical protein [Tepidibacter aestuarii]CAH2214654.1 protein of unknown function [Tepidibacter aestuarii]